MRVIGLTGGMGMGKSHAASLAQASLGLIVSVLFTLGAAPVSYAIIGETSSIRLRPLTTGFGRGIYYIVEFPCIFRRLTNAFFPSRNTTDIVQLPHTCSTLMKPIVSSDTLHPVDDR